MVDRMGVESDHTIGDLCSSQHVRAEQKFAGTRFVLTFRQRIRYCVWGIPMNMMCDHYHGRSKNFPCHGLSSIDT